MSALAEQHKAWVARHERLVNAPAAPKRPVRPRPISPFRPKPPIAFMEVNSVVAAHFAFDESALAEARVVEPHWHRIALEVAAKHGVTMTDLRSARRDRPVVIARQEAMYRCRHETTMSLPQIGAKFNRDHTTALHSVRRHGARLLQEAEQVSPDINRDEPSR